MPLIPQAQLAGRWRPAAGGDIASGRCRGAGWRAAGTTVGIVANTASSDIFNKIGGAQSRVATDPKADAATRVALEQTDCSAM